MNIFLKSIKFKNFLRIGECDLRSLAVMRILLALLMFVDIFHTRFGFLEEFYLSGALVSYQTMSELTNLPHYTFYSGQFFPLGILNDVQSDLFLYVLLSLFICANITFLLGYYTRTSAAVLWLLYTIFHNRFPFISNPGDYIFKLGILVCVFLPLGGAFSIDARRQSKEGEIKYVVRDVSTIFYHSMLLGLICFVGFNKFRPEWVETGEALKIILENPRFVAPLSYLLTDNPFMYKSLSFYTAFAERFFPPLLLLSIRFIKIRLFAVICLLLLFLPIPVFSSVYIVTLVTAALCFGSIPWVFSGMPKYVKDMGWVIRAVKNRSINMALTVGCVLITFTYGYAELNHLLRIFEKPEIPYIQPFKGINSYFSLANTNTMFGIDWSKVPRLYIKIKGNLRNGESIDILTGLPFDPSFPEDPHAAENGFRWKLYPRHLVTYKDRKGGFEKLYDEFRDYYCSRNEQLVSIHILRIHMSGDLTEHYNFYCDMRSWEYKKMEHTDL